MADVVVDEMLESSGEYGPQEEKGSGWTLSL